MRILFWFLRFVLLLLLLAFAIKNDGLVRVQVFFDTAWDLPLIVVILVSFALGILLGVISLGLTVMNLRRELNAAKLAQRAPLPPISPTRLRGQFSDISDSL